MNRKLRSTGHTAVFNWEQLHQRIAAVGVALDETHETNPELLLRAWARRASLIARKPTEDQPGEQCSLVVVRLGAEYYGLEVRYVFDVRPLEKLTTVPRLPQWVLGIVNLRGQIFSVIDLSRFLGVSSTERMAETDYLVVIQTPEMEIALRVDEIIRVESISINRIQDAGGMVLNVRNPYVRGVTELQLESKSAVLMVILDLPVLLHDPQLIINEAGL